MTSTWTRPTPVHRRLLASSALGISAVVFGFADSALALECRTDSNSQHIRDGAFDYRVVPATITSVDRHDPAFQWSPRMGEMLLQRGSTIVSSDPSIYSIARDLGGGSGARTRSGESLNFERLPGTFQIYQVRLAATPEQNGLEPNRLEQWAPPPRSGPLIIDYEFRAADFMAGRWLGLWTRTRGSGPQTVLAHFSGTPGLAPTIIATSSLRFAMLSVPATMHGDSWSFTLFTEARCGEPIHVLTYVWRTGLVMPIVR